MEKIGFWHSYGTAILGLDRTPAYHAGGHRVESLSSGTVSPLSSQRRVAAVLTVAKAIELAWVCHWQRFEQDRVNKREDRCVRSNAGGEGQNGGKYAVQSIWSYSQEPRRT